MEEILKSAVIPTADFLWKLKIFYDKLIKVVYNKKVYAF
jgi:hypothetical protein